MKRTLSISIAAALPSGAGDHEWEVENAAPCQVQERLTVKYLYRARPERGRPHVPTDHSALNR
jgi:hypothetical protein